tara:strand:- start:1394 stop:1690 length:297 start_codon:yes stop_codon:yes gene_type:complete
VLGFSIVLFIICVFISLFFVIFSADNAKKIQSAGVLINLLLLLILTFGFFMRRPEFIDVVLVFLLLNLIGMIGFLRILKQGKLGVNSNDLLDRDIKND